MNGPKGKDSTIKIYESGQSQGLKVDGPKLFEQRDETGRSIGPNFARLSACIPLGRPL